VIEKLKELVKKSTWGQRYIVALSLVVVTHLLGGLSDHKFLYGHVHNFGGEQQQQQNNSDPDGFGSYFLGLIGQGNKTCSSCRGSGRSSTQCMSCRGSGRYGYGPCNTCGGTGFAPCVSCRR
jgi:hypothetical protein